MIMVSLSEYLGLSPILDLEARILRRSIVKEAEFNGLLHANADQRQKYLINKIVDSHELWTVFDGDELPTFISSQNDVLHIWPNEEFALSCYSRTILNPRAVPIPIDDWVDVVLYSPGSNNIDLAYFPVGPERPVKMGSREAFIDLLMSEWRRCFGNHEGFDQNDPENSVTNLIRKGQKQSMCSRPKGKLP
jgi:Protein of unknown function (DUF2750)